MKPKNVGAADGHGIKYSVSTRQIICAHWPAQHSRHSHKLNTNTNEDKLQFMWHIFSSYFIVSRAQTSPPPPPTTTLDVHQRQIHCRSLSVAIVLCVMWCPVTVPLPPCSGKKIYKRYAIPTRNRKPCNDGAGGRGTYTRHEHEAPVQCVDFLVWLICVCVESAMKFSSSAKSAWKRGDQNKSISRQRTKL